jgi:hypothetical protein
MGSSSPTPVKTESTSNSAPWGEQQPFLKYGFDEAKRIYQDPSKPSFYPGQTYAPMSGETGEALTMGADEARKTGSGFYMDPANNPGLRNMIDSTMARVVPGATSPFIAAGRTGSGLANRALGEGVAAGVAPLYQAERDRMIAAPGQLAAVGAERENWAGKPIAESMARHDYNANLDQNKLANFMQMVQGNYGGTNTSTGTQYMPGQNIFGSILGGLMGGTGILGGTGAFGKAGWLTSDARLKENIERVGKTDEGLPIYKYNYKGSMLPQMGVMAQDVERVNPDAVAMMPSGYKAVDYAQVR